MYTLMRAALPLLGVLNMCGIITDVIADVTSRWTDEQKLLYHLRRNYDPAVRPVFDASKPVVVRLGITLAQVLDVDEKNQIITVTVWLDQEWYDEKLTWNKSEFSNITKLRVPCDFLWLPDIVLYNSVDNHNKGYMKSLAMVENSGNVFWPPIVRMRSSCKMDITYFPFDDQVCKLKLGSWAYDGFQVDVVNRTMEVDIENYVDNGEWILIDTRVKRNVVTYPCCSEPYPDVTFYIHIRRRVLYYLFNVIIPCMLLSSLSLTGFLLPADSGEKVTLGLTVLLAFSVFMLLVAENMPPTSEYIPLIGIYLTMIMAMSAFSVALAVFVLNCHHRGTLLKTPPRSIKTLASFVGKLLCMKLIYLDKVDICRYSPHPNYDRVPPVIDNVMRDTSVPAEENTRDVHRKEGKTTDMRTKQGATRELHSNGTAEHVSRSHGTRDSVQANTGPDKAALSVLERDIMTYLKTIMEAYDRSKCDRNIILQWQEVARVLDRFFFVVFVLITLVSSLVLLIVRPLTKATKISDVL